MNDEAGEDGAAASPSQDGEAEDAARSLLEATDAVATAQEGPCVISKQSEDRTRARSLRGVHAPPASPAPTNRSTTQQHGLRRPEGGAQLAEREAGRVRVEAKRLDSVVASTGGEHTETKRRWLGLRGRRTAPERVDVQQAQGVQVGDSNTQVNVFHYKDTAEEDFAKAKALFQESVRHRDQFVGSFLQQALQQANITFRLSLGFLIAGGCIVLIAGAETLLSGGTHGVAVVSALGGAIIGTCGGAFSLRSDRARKHLGVQAERMHSQLLDERKFVQVAELLGGVKDDKLNDRARVALAIQLMSGQSANPQDIDPDQVDEG